MADQGECELPSTCGKAAHCTDNIAGSSDANQVIEISFVQPGPGGPKPLSTFHPKYTFQIFDEEERIFGYQGLRVHLRFAAHDLQPNVEVSYDEKFDAVGGTKAMDIEDTLKEFLPSCELVLRGACSSKTDRLSLQMHLTRSLASILVSRMILLPKTSSLLGNSSRATQAGAATSRFGVAS